MHVDRHAMDENLGAAQYLNASVRFQMSSDSDPRLHVPHVCAERASSQRRGNVPSEAPLDWSVRSNRRLQPSAVAVLPACPDPPDSSVQRSRNTGNLGHINELSSLKNFSGL